jgi:hypothetical protein
MSRPEYKMGVDSAVVLKYGDPDQAVIKGLNKLGLPEMTRETVTVQEFRRDIDIEFTTSGKFGRFKFSGNLVLGDTKGQDQLKQYWKENAKVSDIRFYLDLVHFITVDKANDPDSCVQVVNVSPGEADKNGLYPLSSEMTCGGLVATFVKHLTASTIAFVATGNQITDSASGFVTAGFAAGQTLIVEGTTNNDGQYLIEAVAAGAITIASAFTIIDETAGTDFTLHGGTL